MGYVFEADLDLMTGETTNIREYYTFPGSAPVDVGKLAMEALDDPLTPNPGKPLQEKSQTAAD
jgi:hypothetical protein